MPSRQNLINSILAGDLMDRSSQQDEFNQYQNDEHDSDYNRIEVEFPDNLHIFYSYYSYEDYSGYGFLWGYDESKDTFFYNSGSHCSCYGLEGQWDVEEHTFEEMIAVLERQIEQYDSTDYYYETEKNLYEARVELLKTILGEV